MAGGWAFLMTPPELDLPNAEASPVLSAALLPTSCERIKEAILRELNVRDQWRGRIIISIDSAMKPNTEPVVVAVREDDGFRYEVWTPANIKHRHLSRTLVHVILLEMANRGATGESTRVPLWLVEGMMALVRADSMPTMMLQPNRATPMDVSLVALDSVRGQLNFHAPLTFQEMSWPQPGQITGKDEIVFHASAEMFTYSLIHLPDGQAKMVRFIHQLPAHLNWQVTFLEAFSADFRQLRDVEKWWGLQCLSITGEELGSRWSAPESGRRFQSALDVPVYVHLATNRLPSAAIFRSQDVILKWNLKDQKVVLQRVFVSLHGLRAHLDSEYVPLLNEYMEILSVYLKRHSPSYIRWMRADSNSARFRESTARKLSRLDERLNALQGRIAAAELLKQARNLKTNLPAVNPAVPVAGRR
jgi:hypothetical protein